MVQQSSSPQWLEMLQRRFVMRMCSVIDRLRDYIRHYDRAVSLPLKLGMRLRNFRHHVPGLGICINSLL